MTRRKPSAFTCSILLHQLHFSPIALDLAELVQGNECRTGSWWELSWFAQSSKEANRKRQLELELLKRLVPEGKWTRKNETLPISSTWSKIRVEDFTVGRLDFCLRSKTNQTIVMKVCGILSPASKSNHFSVSLMYLDFCGPTLTRLSAEFVEMWRKSVGMKFEPIDFDVYLCVWW